ncbi:MAG: GNAT family N-acetyltransferase [bacterium]
MIFSFLFKKFEPVLIPYEADKHLNLLYSWISSDEIMRMYDLRITSKEEVEEWFKHDLIYLIQIDNTLAGYINLCDIDNSKGSAELGYMLIEKYRGKGYMNVPIEFMISKARELKLKKLVAYTILGNVKSQKILLKHGFVFAKKSIEPDWSHYDGEVEWNWYELTV